jgi:hypothetical protein
MVQYVRHTAFTAATKNTQTVLMSVCFLLINTD